MFAFDPTLGSFAMSRDDDADSTFVNPPRHFSPAECRAWIATLIALRAYPRRRSLASAPVACAQADGQRIPLPS